MFSYPDYITFPVTSTTTLLSYSIFAAIIFKQSERGKINAYIAPITISNCCYILRKPASHKKIVNNLRKLLIITRITSISKQDVILTLYSKFNDLEDALQRCSAISHSKIDIILTRNVKDFKNSEIPVMTLEAYLKARSVELNI